MSKQYVTELRVEAHTDQVSKLRAELEGIQRTIQAIRSAGPVGVQAGAAAMGGAASVGAGGPATAAPPAPAGVAPSAVPVGAGGVSGSMMGAGGPLGGSPPPGVPPPAQGRTPGARWQRPRDFGVPSSTGGAIVGAAAAAGAVVGLGSLTGGIAADYLRAVDKAIEADKARSRLRGLTGGSVGSVSGTGLGFTPSESAGIAGEAAAAGLGASATRRLARVAMQFERIGIGAGAATGFGAAFATGAGAVGGDASAAIQAVFGLAVESGLRAAQVPSLLEKVSSATTAMAERGADVDVTTVLRNIAEVRALGGGAKSLEGVRSAAVFENIAQLARTVAGGGGSSIQQEVMLRAAGLGQIDPETGRPVDLVGARARLERLEGRGSESITRSVMRQARMAGGGDRSATALFLSQVLGVSGLQQGLDLATGGPGGIPGAIPMGVLGRMGIAGASAAATSGLMVQSAGIEASDVLHGRRSAGAVMDMRRQMQGARQGVADTFIAPAVKEAAIFMKKAAADGVSAAVGQMFDRVTGAASSAAGEALKRAKEAKGDKGADLRGPGGVLRIELSPDVEHLFRMAFDPGVPA